MGEVGAVTMNNGASAGHSTLGTNRSGLPLVRAALAVAGFLIAMFLGMAVPDQDALGLDVVEETMQPSSLGVWVRIE